MPKGYVPFYSLSGFASTGAGLPADTSASTTDLLMQITITETATVKVEASEDLANWTNVSGPGFTASTIVSLDARVPFYRANVTAFTSGTVTAVVSSGRGRFKELMNVSSPQGGGTSNVDLTLLLQERVPTSRRIDTTLPLEGGGDLSVDRTHSLGTQAANTLLSGPASGGAAAPGFRALALADIANRLITFAKLPSVAVSKLLGRGDSGAGDAQEITLGTNLSMSGATLNAATGSGAPTTSEYLVGAADATLSAERVVTDTTSVTWDLATASQAKAKRAALTGDVTASADSNATAIANDAVTMTKLADLAASTVIGRRSGSAGDPEAVTLGSGLAMSAGAVLSATGGSGGHTVKEAGAAMTARTGLNFLAGFDLADDAGGDETEVALDLSEIAGGGDLSWAGNVPTIPNDTVTYAKMQNVSAPSRLLGRDNTGAGDTQEIMLGSGLSMSGTTLSATGGGGSEVEEAWQKSFFSGASLLPATERVAASLVTFPTETGTVLGGGGSITKDLGHMRSSGSTTTQIAYYDLGALRGEVLAVLGGMTTSGSSDDVGFALSSAVPTTGLPDGFLGSVSPLGPRIFKVVSGTPTQLGIAAGFAPIVPAVSGVALYYKDSTDVLKLFVRVTGTWFLAVDLTDTSHTTMRYVSIRFSVGGGSPTLRAILPFTVWSD